MNVIEFYLSSLDPVNPRETALGAYRHLIDRNKISDLCTGLDDIAEPDATNALHWLMLELERGEIQIEMREAA